MKYKKETIDQLINLIKDIRNKVTDDSDVVWSGYDTPAQMRLALDEHLAALSINDLSRLDDLYLLFAPTGRIQEHSISNGWVKKYLELSELFDILYHKLK